LAIFKKYLPQNDPETLALYKLKGEKRIKSLTRASREKEKRREKKRKGENIIEKRREYNIILLSIK